MSSSIGERDQPPLGQKVVGAIFFILPVAFIVVFLCWCWRRQRRSAQLGPWAGLMPVVTPQCISMESLPTAPELHSVHVQLEAGGVKLHWSGIKPVYATFWTNSLSEQPESSSGPITQVGVFIRMPSREAINTAEYAHLRGVIVLGSTNYLHVLE